MPELPEVEIVRQSLDKKIKQKKVRKVIIRNRNLRFKIPSNFSSFLKNQKIVKVDRFSKYLINGVESVTACSSPSFSRINTGKRTGLGGWIFISSSTSSGCPQITSKGILLYLK